MRRTVDGISVIVPAHNEGSYIRASLGSIATAASRTAVPVETIVVANRCTDGTAGIARSLGAAVVESDARNIAAVRNAGAAAGTRSILVSMDADCQMHPDTLTAVASRLGTGAHIGGGVRVIPERRSAGICATYAVMEAVSAVTRLGGGVFWCFRGDFDAVGGFDENRELAEDLDFARRLRRRGRQTRRRFTNLRRTPVVASCRKFDRFGDWHMFHMPFEARQIYAATRRTDPAWVDRYFYDFND